MSHRRALGFLAGALASPSVCLAASGLLWACGSSGSGSQNQAPGAAGSPGAANENTQSLDPARVMAPTAATGGSGGAASSEAPPDVGGLETDPNTVLGNGGASGAPRTEPMEEPEEPPAPVDPRPFFSFFITSQAGLYGLPAGEFAPAPDPAQGHGGNFGGLAGADEICTMLARQASPGDIKVWRAFLSTSGMNGGEQVDAIDRIGEGPWYNDNGLKLADDIAGLMPQGNDGRPQGADPQLADMFTDENGEDIQPNAQVDNHDTLTGSDDNGRLFDDGEGGRVATCEDWTSNTVRGEEGNAAGNGGQVPVGHSWPRNNNMGRHWISEHTINGCEPGFDINGGAGAPEGDFRVGAGGGFGGIYCFALGAVPPE